MADMEKVTRLMITLKIAIVVVEIVSKKLNLTAFSGLNRKADKTGDAIIIMITYTKQENKKIMVS